MMILSLRSECSQTLDFEPVCAHSFNEYYTNLEDRSLSVELVQNQGVQVTVDQQDLCLLDETCSQEAEVLVYRNLEVERPTLTVNRLDLSEGELLLNHPLEMVLNGQTSLPEGTAVFINVLLTRNGSPLSPLQLLATVGAGGDADAVLRPIYSFAFVSEEHRDADTTAYLSISDGLGAMSDWVNVELNYTSSAQVGELCGGFEPPY